MLETFFRDVKLHIRRTSNILAVSEAVRSPEATTPATVIQMLAFRLICNVYLVVQKVFLIKILFVG
jgi:hypothetical protein